MLRALIFDVDGTLADTENVHRVAFNRAFVAEGLHWHWDKPLYGQLLKIAGGKERIRHYIHSARGGEVDPSNVDALVARLHAEKTRRYERLIEQGSVRLRPGVAELIEVAAESGVKLGIATTTSPQNVTALLHSQLGRYGIRAFAAIAAGDCVKNKKPAPDIYLQALEQLRVPAPLCLAVEDSSSGLRAALKAGLATVVTPSSYTAAEDFRGAACVTPTLAELGRKGWAGSIGSGILRALRRLHVTAQSQKISCGRAS